MSEYNMLVNGLRERAEHAATEGNMTATCDARYFSQAADAIEALVKRAEKAEAEVERLKGVLQRLGSAEAFDMTRALDAKDAELIMRMDFARSALEAKP